MGATLVRWEMLAVYTGHLVLLTMTAVMQNSINSRLRDRLARPLLIHESSPMIVHKIYGLRLTRGGLEAPSFVSVNFSHSACRMMAGDVCASPA